MLMKHPDPTVDHVLKTWAPRMIVQGVDYNDLITTSARIRVWDDWCRAWCVTAAGHEAFARENETKGNRDSATEAYLLAAMAYHFGCNNSPRIWSSMFRHIIRESSAMRRLHRTSIRRRSGTKCRSKNFVCLRICAFQREPTGHRW